MIFLPRRMRRKYQLINACLGEMKRGGSYFDFNNLPTLLDSIDFITTRDITVAHCTGSYRHVQQFLEMHKGSQMPWKNHNFFVVIEWLQFTTQCFKITSKVSYKTFSVILYPPCFVTTKWPWSWTHCSQYCLTWHQSTWIN